MPNNIPKTRTLAKNSAMMYGRMIITMIVSLYTSRVILNALGVQDYGIYNLVGSIVVMFDSLRTVFCSSTQRYINYEMGAEHKEKFTLVFNMSIFINFIISLVFLISVEIVGIWFMNTNMNVPTDRFYAANVVFQLSVATAIVGVIMSTFDAVIVAHERMDFYAGMAIVSVFSKLGIAYFISVVTSDKLIVYACLMFGVQMFIYIINFIFCRFKFQETKFCRCWNKQYFKEMTVFAGWNFFGNTAFALTQNGMNMVLNVFGGPVVNAARGIAFQVNNALQQAINNIAIVIKPFAIQTYAKGEYTKAFNILYLSSKLYFVVQMMIVIVFTFFTKDIIQLWLGQVPDYVVPFLTLILWYSLVRAIHNPMDILFFSVGDMKYYQICEGIVLAAPILFSYIALKLGCAFYVAFVVQLVIEAVNLFFITIIARKVCKLDMTMYIKSVFLPCGLAFIMYLAFFYTGNYLIEDYFIKILNAVFALFVQLIFMLFVGCSKYERQILMNSVKGIIHRK